MNFKKCRLCYKRLKIDNFRPLKTMSTGYRNECRECEASNLRIRRKVNGFNEWQINYRLGKGKDVSSKYQKTEKRREAVIKYNDSIKGIETKTFCGMRYRNKTITKHKNHRICSEKEFLNWAKENRNILQILRTDWLKNSKNTKLRPSIDRIDNSRGYEIDNIRWCTLSENASKADK